jgi:hypothetical protein
MKSHARPNHVDRSGTANARRKQTQRKLAFFVNNRMTRIAAALKPDDYIRSSRQGVRYFAFPLVSPIRAHDRRYRHIPLPLSFLSSSFQSDYNKRIDINKMNSINS